MTRCSFDLLAGGEQRAESGLEHVCPPPGAMGPGWVPDACGTVAAGCSVGIDTQYLASDQK